MEHELGAISQGITRIRVTRALQSQEETMSLVFDRNDKSTQRREELAYLESGQPPWIGVKENQLWFD